MKVRICFLVMALAPILYYGFAQMAPAGRAATVSAGFHQLGKAALVKIESAQDALSDSEDVFNQRITEADYALSMASRAAHTEADQRDYVRLVSYMRSVKQDRTLMQIATDPSQQPDLEQTNAARRGAESAFQ
jgi:hypothetical protein